MLVMQQIEEVDGLEPDAADPQIEGERPIALPEFNPPFEFPGCSVR